MIQARKRLQTYQETFYLVYILIIHGMRSLGKGTFDIFWLSAIAFTCLGIKLVLTDYTKKELLWMILFGSLIMVSFFFNHEKTLLLTVFAIYGAKNVDLDKVFLYGLWSRVILIGGQITLVFLGVIEGGYSEEMPKYFALTGEKITYAIPKLGFTHPNYAYLSIVMTALLAVLVYRERLKWYGYAVITLILYGFYRILLCRTGWYMWLLTICLILCYRLALKIKWQELYLKCVCMLPVFLSVFCLAVLILLSRGNSFAVWIDRCMTGRFGRFGIAGRESLPELFGSLWGHRDRTANEIAYIQLPYNYGWPVYLSCLAVYVKVMWSYVKEKKDYFVLILGAISICFIGEAVPLSAGWNLSMLLVSCALFQTGKEKMDVSEGSAD